VQAVWISSFARSSGITHVLYLFTINQELPKLKLPSGIIVHDLNWRKYPQNWPGQSADDLDDELKGWIGYAGRIFAVSHFVRDEIMELEPSCGDKVVVVPWASSSCLGGQVNRSASAGFVAPAKPFVLYPAAVHAHKGHHLLLKAFELLASKGHDFDLVLTGGGTEGFASECALGAPWSEDCRTLLSSFSPAWQARVHALGRVTADELRELYSTCAVVVLPTEYEGCGLPLSEAVAWGARVVCSDIPPFKEQAELFGQSEDLTWFDPGNVMQLARCIESVIKNKSKSRENSGSAVHNAVSNKRSWPDVAECFITALRRIG
jgi:alpha-1,3-rhamnosyl/mannosyltransferase